MELLVLFSVVIIAFWGLAYWEAPFLVWAATLGAALLVIAIKGLLSPFFVYSLLAVLIVLCVGFGYAPFRRRVLTLYLFRAFKNALPTISATERAAIESGDVWWEGELFQGRPNWDKFLTLPKPALSPEERSFLDHEVEHLFKMFEDWNVTHVRLDLPEKVWHYLKEKRFFGMIIPKAYGGLEFSALAHSCVIQKMATHSLTAAITAMVPNSLGPAELLMHYGTEEQKQHYLPKLATGEEVPCFALTSLEAGSDAGAIVDKGIICKGMHAGKEVIGMRLTWDKRYITLAPVATVLGLAFKLYDPDQLLGTREELGITLCLIPTTHPGVEVGLRHFPLNQPFMNGPTRGQDVFVPLDWIIGGKKNIGKGWRMLVECLAAGRGISLPALSAASTKVCYRTSGAYSVVRKQFRTSIGKFAGVEAVLAKIAGCTYMIEASRLLTLTGIDQHIRPSVVTAIAKYHITEMGREAMKHAMDVHGGRAIMLGPNNYLGRGYESIPISITVEGANILTRNLMIFGQGSVRCHPYIRLEMEAMGNKDETVGVKQFDEAFFKHVHYTLSNIAKILVHSLTAGLFCSAPKGVEKELRSYYRQLSRMSIAMAFVSDLSLVLLGGKLKRLERLSARLGDVLSYLYIASAVLKYYQDFGNSKDDIIHVHWSLKIALYSLQKSLIKFFKNFPIRFIGTLLRWMVFPYGRAYIFPDDTLDHCLAKSMMVPSDFRDRLTEYGYMTKHEGNPMVKLELAFHQMLSAQPLYSKLEKAIKQGTVPKWLGMEDRITKAMETGILTREEADSLRVCEKARVEALRVDEFSQDQLMGK